jgi:hypothetical protein
MHVCISWRRNMASEFLTARKIGAIRAIPTSITMDIASPTSSVV